MGGNPAFRGTRVPVHMLAELVPSRTRYRRGSVGLPLSRTSTRSECATASLGSRATARAETCGSSRDRQFAEVEGIAFHYQFLPGCTVDALDRPVILAALAKARREHAGLDPIAAAPADDCRRCW